MNLESIQCELQKAGLDGWLFFDHHERDPLAYRVLGLKPPGHVSRRWYYFIPARGEPRGLVHQVEPHVLDPLPGLSWKAMLAAAANSPAMKARTEFYPTRY